MKIRILGSAAGGGFPQWNCNCRNCAGLRSGTLRAQPRTQSSLAVNGGDPTRWVLINASPDILAQLRANPQLQPGRAPHDSAISAIVLTDAQIDHSTGLYMLRESTRPLAVWCTEQAYADLTQGNPIFTVLGHYCGIERRELASDGRAFRVDGIEAIEWRALAVAGRPAPYSPHRAAPRSGDNVALVMRVGGRSAVYAPGIAAMTDALWRELAGAACVLVDGTFWSDDELVRLGLTGRRARDLGHLPQAGPGGMLEWLDRLPGTTRRILIHVNNTNPILDEDSSERAELARRGVEVGYDGLEIEL